MNDKRPQIQARDVLTFVRFRSHKIFLTQNEQREYYFEVKLKFEVSRARILIIIPFGIHLVLGLLWISHVEFYVQLLDFVVDLPLSCGIMYHKLMM